MTRQWLDEAIEAGQTDAYASKRSDPRTRWPEPLEIHIFKDSGCWLSRRATARDISAGGIGFQCREAIPCWTPILICRAGELVGAPAMVMHCTRGATNYVIGAEFRFEDRLAQPQAITKAG